MPDVGAVTLITTPMGAQPSVLLASKATWAAAELVSKATKHKVDSAFMNIRRILNMNRVVVNLGGLRLLYR